MLKNIPAYRIEFRELDGKRVRILLTSESEVNVFTPRRIGYLAREIRKDHNVKGRMLVILNHDNWSHVMVL